jgi:hypothetical protein
MSRSKTSKPRYVLGTSTHLFTGLGEFRSIEAAQAYWHSLPRNGVAYVHEECDVSRNGVVFGLNRKIVATA